jgi:hypothetical protein
VLIACIARRTNLTMRELAALFATSRSTAHRVVVAMTARLATCAAAVNQDRRWAWVVDGTLIRPAIIFVLRSPRTAGGRVTPRFWCACAIFS